jgi:hypothetical protein
MKSYGTQQTAFDNIQRQILFNILKSRNIPDTLLKAIVDIYKQNKILIKFNSKISKSVEIKKGVHQGCPLSKEIRITRILNKLLEYKRNWIQHVSRMPRNRLPRVMKHYSPNGRRNHGRPLKRLLDA